MTYIPRTSFRRAVDAAQIKHLQTEAEATLETSADKWELLRHVGSARKALGLSDRSVSVLQALLSFHPSRVLELQEAGLIVFPSNEAICARLNHMPCSTMRRHLRALLDAGLIIRRDSPNGKRFSRAQASFGFDLTPLVRRAQELEKMAAALEAKAAQLRDLRLSVSLAKRDLLALARYAQLAPEHIAKVEMLDQHVAKALRRKDNASELEELCQSIARALAEIMALLDVESDKASTSDSQNEHHHHNSDKETYLKEPKTLRSTSHLPFRMVQDTCRELQLFSNRPLESWSTVADTAKAVAPMIGITRAGWERAVETMGLRACAVTVALLLERFSEIRNAGAYLRHLSEKAGRGLYSPLPMLEALSKRQGCVSSQL